MKVAREAWRVPHICQKSDKCPFPIDTKKEVAKIAGVSHDTVAKVKKVIAKAPEEVKDN